MSHLCLFPVFCKCSYIYIKVNSVCFKKWIHSIALVSFIHSSFFLICKCVIYCINKLIQLWLIEIRISIATKTRHFHQIYSVKNELISIWEELSYDYKKKSSAIIGSNNPHCKRGNDGNSMVMKPRGSMSHSLS